MGYASFPRVPKFWHFSISNRDLIRTLFWVPLLYVCGSALPLPQTVPVRFFEFGIRPFLNQHLPAQRKQSLDFLTKWVKNQVLCPPHFWDQDAALILREDDTMDLAIPEVTTDYVPDHILMTAALAHALSVPELCDKIRETFLEATYKRGASTPNNDNF